MMKKFQCAFNGLIEAVKDSSVLIQCVLAAMALCIGWVFQFEYFEWLILLICISLVIGFEMINTVIEKLCDLYTVEQCKEIKEIKDMAAGAVLFMALVSLVIGCCILLKHMMF